MKNLRVLLLLTLDKWTGAAKRTCEILKRGKEHNIDYIIAFDEKCFCQSIRRYPFYAEILKRYRVYLVDLSCFRTRVIATYKEMWKTGIRLGKIAKQEKADLIVSPSEAEWMLVEAFLASTFSGIPWTAIWQGADETLVAPANMNAITPLNVFRHIGSKLSCKESRLVEKITRSFTLLNQLKIAEKTLLLAVSPSLIEQVLPLNPQLKFNIIFPGVGVTLEKYQKKIHIPKRYHAIFFARLVPEKGLFDLPIIWKLVTAKCPEAKLAIAGEADEGRHFDKFRKLINREKLTKNIIFLGMLDEPKLIEAIKSSCLTIYPSLFDTFALVVLESLACGVPVVSYNIPAIRHNYGKCRAVLRCPINDKENFAAKVQFLLENKEERNKLSKEAEEYALNYDWEKVIQAEKKAYINVINEFRKNRILSEYCKNISHI